MDDPECGLRQLQALKALGVRLAIDDFGTGRAPLSFLQRFPVDFLKMDQSFLASFGDSGAGASLARATLGLGKTLGLRTVAKGVESRVQWETLRMLGCDLCQGYFLSPPVDPPAVSALCASPQTEWSAAAPAGPAREVTAALLPI